MRSTGAGNVNCFEALLVDLAALTARHLKKGDKVRQPGIMVGPHRHGCPAFSKPRDRANHRDLPDDRA
jgi:hypothetical protein